MELIRLPEIAGILIITWIAILFCWEEFIHWWSNKNNDR
jgi:hypothetical protein